MNVLKKHYEPLAQGLAYMSYNEKAIDLMLANSLKSYGEIKINLLDIAFMNELLRTLHMMKFLMTMRSLL